MEVDVVDDDDDDDDGGSGWWKKGKGCIYEEKERERG